MAEARHRLRRPWESTGIDSEALKRCLGDKVVVAQDAVALSEQIGPILAAGTKGNPRQIKRFLNMLVLRSLTAEARGFGEDIRLPILAKLMLAERFIPRLFEQIAVAAAVAPDGRCRELAELETIIRTDSPPQAAEVESQTGGRAGREGSAGATASENSMLAEWLTSPAVKAWAAVSPALASVDLRPYLFVAKDRKDFFGANSGLGHLAPLVEQMLGPKFSVQAREAEVKRLTPPEAAQLFEAVRARVVGSDSFDAEPNGAAGLAAIIKAHPALQGNLLDFLQMLPSWQIGPLGLQRLGRRHKGSICGEEIRRTTPRVGAVWKPHLESSGASGATNATGNSLVGTSNSFRGPGTATPLVPSWLNGGAAPDGDDATPPSSVPPSGDAPVPADASPDGATPAVPPAPVHPPIPQSGDADRFSAARNNFSRFASSGGHARSNLGRAVSHYVGTSSGGASNAARRMGASRRSATGLYGFLSEVVTSGAARALRTLHLESLAGQPIETIFLALSDYFCPDGGSVDEGIARDAFVETIVDLADSGVTDLDGMTAEQMKIVFELYITNAIEDRICNDIGGKAIVLPADAREAWHVEHQLHDFILRAVADALERASCRGHAHT